MTDDAPFIPDPGLHHAEKAERFWTPDTIAELERLWNQSDPYLSTAEIAEKLGTTKNAAVGKAHRLGLPGRPDPIIRRPKPDPNAYTGPTCQWFHGHPRRCESSDDMKCGAPVTDCKDGTPSAYCADHHHRCYSAKPPPDPTGPTVPEQQRLGLPERRRHA